MKNTILKGLVVAAAVPFMLVLGNTDKALAVTISSTVTGSSNPTPVIDSTFENGGFTLTANPGNPTVTSLGDGRDENTWWVFDYSNDPNLQSFRNAVTAGNAITSALLSVTLQPGGFNDNFSGAGGGVAISTLASNGLVNVNRSLQTFTIDLLGANYNNSTSTRIFNELDASTASNRNVSLAPDAGQNQILFGYQDDAIISNARLDLTTEEVPEPMTILGTLTAVGFGTVLRRKRQQSQLN